MSTDVSAMLAALDAPRPPRDPSDPPVVGPGTVIAGYQLEAEIGIGGAARVFRARHVHPAYAEQAFAVKVLDPALASSPLVREHFLREAFIMAELRHPNIVRTLDAGTDGEHLFIAMELIDGRDLGTAVSRLRRRGRRLQPEVAVHVARETLRALAAAHALTAPDGAKLGVVHRDVNPGNVFLCYQGWVKLADFGIAELGPGPLDSEVVAGTPGYFAPEQLAGEAVDARADLFAVGVVLYELLAGQPLFAGKDADDVMQKNQRARVPPLPDTVPPELDRVVRRALAPRPADRFASADDMCAALAPFTERAPLMTLAVAAVMRDLLSDRLLVDLARRDGSSPLEAIRGERVRLEAAPAVGQALSAPLRGAGLVVDDGAEHAAGGVAGTARSPALALIELAEAAAAGGRDGQAPVPTIAMAPALDARWLAAAAHIGAVDLLWGEPSGERVLGACAYAILERRRREARQAGRDRTRQRLLLVSGSPGLRERLRAGLEPYALRLLEADGVAEAERILERTSPRALVLDAAGDVDVERALARLRAAPGIGMLPAIVLADRAGAAPPCAADAVHVRERGLSAGALAATARDVLADARFGRTFLRYDCALPLELHFSGRVARGVTRNVSRGGALLRIDQVPAREARVLARLEPGGGEPTLELRATVVRLAPPASGHALLSEVAVEWDLLAEPFEARVVALVRRLAAGARSKG